MALDVAGKYRYPPPDAEWLSRHREEILEPERPIVDAHHHLWEEQSNRYLLDELADDLASGHRIDATIFVQAHYGYRDWGPVELRPAGEVEKAAAMGESARLANIGTDVAAAIVGYADLTLGGAVEPVLDAHEIAGRGRFRGVRHSVARDSNFPGGIVLRPAPAGLLGDLGYRAGLAALAARGLSYDAMLYHEQIGELTAMARALPHLSIVLDHLGCPIGVGPYRSRQKETFEQWRRDITGLASCPNVHVKLGGLGMVICGATWRDNELPPSSAELAQAWRPMVETCIDLFGVNRCMFESNFPVDKGMFAYSVFWNAAKRLTSGASNDEKDALFASTARYFYRLPNVEKT